MDAAWRVLEAVDDRHQHGACGIPPRAGALRRQSAAQGDDGARATSARSAISSATDASCARYAAAASEMFEYALARHVAEPLIGELADEPRDLPADVDRAGRRPRPNMLPPVRAFGFGRGSVLVGERQVSDLEWRSEKSKEMFFFLLSRREAVTKEEIFGALWPDLPESKCNSNFHSSLYRLRRALFQECVVSEADGSYLLNPRGDFTSDVDAFNAAMLEAEVARDEAARAAKLEDAIALYKGPFLSSSTASGSSRFGASWRSATSRPSTSSPRASSAPARSRRRWCCSRRWRVSTRTARPPRTASCGASSP